MSQKLIDLFDPLIQLKEQALIKENTQPDSEDIDRLQEIADEIKGLVYEAKELIPRGSIRNQAESYWIPHILGAIDKDNEYLGGSMTTMSDTIEKLKTSVDLSAKDIFTPFKSILNKNKDRYSRPSYKTWDDIAASILIDMNISETLPDDVYDKLIELVSNEFPNL
jgi:hypothetical protein